MTIPYIYKLTHLPSLMWYIGSRSKRGCYPEDGYMGSSLYVTELVNKNPTHWKKEIIMTGNPVEIRSLEEDFLKTLDAKNDPRSFNRTNHLQAIDKQSIEGKIRIHFGNKNICVSKEELEIFLNFGWQLGFSENVKKKMSENHANVSGKNNPMYGVSRIGHNTGFKFSEEQRNKLKKPKTEKHKKALSISKIGKNNPMFGKKRIKKTCNYCLLSVADNTYARWHGENCKKKERI